MKVEIKEEGKQEEIKYPCLMTAATEGHIVLMSEYGKGILLRLGDEQLCVSVGQYHHDWAMPFFTPFKGSITLSND